MNQEEGPKAPASRCSADRCRREDKGSLPAGCQVAKQQHLWVRGLGSRGDPPCTPLNAWGCRSPKSSWFTDKGEIRTPDQNMVRACVAVINALLSQFMRKCIRHVIAFVFWTLIRRIINVIIY